MKHPKKERSPAAKRPRRVVKEVAPETPPTHVAPAPAEVPASEPAVATILPASTDAVGPLSDEILTGTPVTVSVRETASRRGRAEQIVQEYMSLAAGAGMIPLPGVDLAVIGGLQFKVLAALAAHYKVPFAQAQAQAIVTSLVGSVGTTFLAGAALSSVAKIVPFFGTLVGAVATPVAGGAITRALGHLAIDHFEAGGTMATFDLDVAQRAFLEKIAAAQTAPA